jgi:L,D-transpeptidase YcbB
MRLFYHRLFVATCAVLWSAAASADRPDLQAAPGSLPFAEAVMPSVVFSLDALAPRAAPKRVKNRRKRKAKVQKPKPEVAWGVGLRDYYSRPFAEPVWVSLEGYTPRAKAVIAEMKRADEYGLDPNAFHVPALPDGEVHLRELAQAEVKLSLSVARYVWHARGGRIDPEQLSLWLNKTPRPVDTSKVLGALTDAPDAAAQLRGYHPQHPQFEALRQAYLAERNPNREKKQVEQIPYGPRIKVGQRHPDVSAVRRRLGLPSSLKNDTLFDRKLRNALRRYMRKAGFGRRTRYIDNRVRKALNNPKDDRSRSANLDALLVNMERWRWLPRDLGDLHIWNNLPTFATQVVKHDRVIHKERIIVGKTSTQTPVFSHTMSHVIFNPEWGVPESIKISSLLRNLKGGDYDVLRRRGMYIRYGEKRVSPHKIDWQKVKIRDIPIFQRAGRSNPLGRLKFMFPNKHAVYMHDTPKKHLFKSKARTFSHGCIRVRNPVRLAEVVLAETNGWQPDQISDQLSQRSTIRLDFEKDVPVHNVYFTRVADVSGTVRSLKDIYRHDRRIAQALAGKDPKAIAARDPARAQKRRNAALVKAAEEESQFNAWGEYEDDYYWFGGQRARPYRNPFSAYNYSPPKRYKRGRKRRKNYYSNY